MHHKKIALYFLFAGLALVFATSLFLVTASPASAQCGSQASSCKNCHEVQGEMPVNSDGTNWHQSHAFGDFCYICHAGNNQSKDEAAAHEGMVPPLSDINASCQQCHVADLDERAQVYATALGVEVGSGSASVTSGASDAAVPSTSSTPNVTSGQNCNEMVVDDPNIINYAQSYDEIVLGKNPTNWGNMILLGMIGLITVGGGGFVVTREKLVNVKFGDTRKADIEYPTDVVEMLPKIAGLKTRARKSLKHILDNPQKADKVLDLMNAVVSEETDEE